MYGFINADSQLNTVAGVLGYNLFAYCNNNPVKLTDPDGHFPFLAITAAIGAVAGAVIGGVRAAKSGKSVWKGALKGAAIGGLIGLGAGVAAGVGLQSTWATIDYPLLQGRDIIYGVASQSGSIQIMP